MKQSFKKEYCFICIIILTIGCNYLIKDQIKPETIIATINNEPITEDYFKTALQRHHLSLKEDSKTKEAPDIKNFLEKIIDQWLIVQEARKIGLHKDEIFVNAKKKEIIRQSVPLLYKEEIEGKITVDDQQMWDYYITLLKEGGDYIDTNHVSKKSFHKNRQRIKKLLLRKKKKQREIEYIGHLREKYGVHLNSETYDNDAIDRSLIDREAMSRDYSKRDEVKNRLREWENRTLYKLYIDKFLLPAIRVDDHEELLYYRNHPERFHAPVFVKIEEIAVATSKEAEEIMRHIKEGTDYEFLTYLSLPERIKADAWQSTDKIPSIIKNSIAPLKEGDIAGPLKQDNGYSFYFLKSRKGGELIPFEKIRPAVKKYVHREKYEQKLGRIVNQLRANATITYNRGLINRLSPQGGKIE
ncbi:MAG: peptidyl-prolyl cis-trans isomerase [bacterium]